MCEFKWGIALSIPGGPYSSLSFSAVPGLAVLPPPPGRVSPQHGNVGVKLSAAPVLAVPFRALAVGYPVGTHQHPVAWVAAEILVAGHRAVVLTWRGEVGEAEERD